MRQLKTTYSLTLKAFCSFMMTAFCSFIIMAFCSLMMMACSSDEGFTAGPKIAEDNPGVFFPSTNESTILRGENEAKSISIAMKRTNTKGELKVPVTIVSKSSDVTMDEYAVFKDGEDATSITCSYADLDNTPQFEISVSEEYGNPYTIKKGSTHYAAKVYKLNTICESVYVTPYTASSKDLFSGVTGQAIYQMGHDNHFIWKNFLGSGIDFHFYIDGTFDANNITLCKGGILPMANNWDDDYGWYLMKDASPVDFPEDDSACAKWSPEGSSVNIGGYMYFYRKYNGTEYFYINFSKHEGTDCTYSYGWISSAIISENGRGTSEKEIKSYNTYYFYLYY